MEGSTRAASTASADIGNADANAVMEDIPLAAKSERAAPPAAPPEGPRGFTLTWESLSCRVSSGGWFEKRTQTDALLGCSAFALPGRALAVIGPSGAGKTTLIDILAGRKARGAWTGDVRVNGLPSSRALRTHFGIVDARMACIPSMTVRETLEFAAACRMPRSCTAAERSARVDEVIAALHLGQARDTRLGDEVARGVSTGERKRVEVAIELIGRPKTLILDEPTSGLDAHLALLLMEQVLECARAEGVCVICVVHQPGPRILALFDQCLLLGGGRTCYFGPSGSMESYFAALGLNAAKQPNPVEAFLDAVLADPATWAELYRASPLAASTMGTIAKLNKSLAELTDNSERAPPTGQGFFGQLRLLGDRCLLRYWRNPATSWGRTIIFMAISVIFGVFYRDSGNDLFGITNQAAAVSINLNLVLFLAASAIPQFIGDREVFLQEVEVGCYSTFAYWASYFLVECILVLATASLGIFFTLILTGITPGFYGTIYPMILLCILCATSLVQATAAWSSNAFQAFQITMFFSMVFTATQTLSSNYYYALPIASWVRNVNFERWGHQIYLLAAVPYVGRYICPPVGIQGMAAAIANGTLNALSAPFANPDAANAFWDRATLVSRVSNARAELASSSNTPASVVASLSSLTDALPTGLVPNPANFSLPAALSLLPMREGSSAIFAALAPGGGDLAVAEYCVYGDDSAYSYLSALFDLEGASVGQAYAALGGLLACTTLLSLVGLYFARMHRRR
ncbi:hypothetical protein DFJ74DRAFT_694843 [Hyaloraphidium curvatum]|nr:hypothetical protein DFJ74DRAFT_694843 [Hyaloraphidium curvatum]